MPLPLLGSVAAGHRTIRFLLTLQWLLFSFCTPARIAKCLKIIVFSVFAFQEQKTSTRHTKRWAELCSRPFKLWCYSSTVHHCLQTDAINHDNVKSLTNCSHPHSGVLALSRAATLVFLPKANFNWMLHWEI
jgi:hypothetical protein